MTCERGDLALASFPYFAPVLIENAAGIRAVEPSRPQSGERSKNRRRFVPSAQGHHRRVARWRRLIYQHWARVIEYFDVYLIGLIATPNKQTCAFFRQDLVMDSAHEQAVARGVNANSDVYCIKTQFTEGGSSVEAGYYVEQQDRETRESAGSSWTKTGAARPGSSTATWSPRTRFAPWCAPSAISCSARYSPAASGCPRPPSSPRAGLQLRIHLIGNLGDG